MPMKEDQYGTNKDGSANSKYCCYCYKDGEFAQKCSMEEMVDFCAPFEVEGGRCKTLEEAKAILAKARKEKLPIVDDDFNLKGLITIKDIENRLNIPCLPRIPRDVCSAAPV